MVIDTFLFNNEFDILDIRLALTESYVDRWVVCEGNRTLSSQPKPYYLSDNIERYSRWGDRLKVIKLDIPESWSNWDIENGQRAAITPGYADAGDNDIVTHSDLDEILNPAMWPEIVAFLEQEKMPISCTLDMYIYRFDQKVDRKWGGNVVAKKYMFKNPCTLYKGLGAGVGHAQKRKERSHCVAFPKTVGWHWTWMGNDDVIKTKVMSCIESQSKDSQQVLDSFKQLDAASAINHKAATMLVNPGYPDNVMQVLKQYPYWT